MIGAMSGATWHAMHGGQDVEAGLLAYWKRALPWAHFDLFVFDGPVGLECRISLAVATERAWNEWVVTRAGLGFTLRAEQWQEWGWVLRGARRELSKHEKAYGDMVRGMGTRCRLVPIGPDIIPRYVRD